ncbi:helix-turn-helix domain-containing protein [Candidatus Nitrotoga sp. M5]|uniref:helix-turn-helix domain-containing protein n=1 Tax=Candidatus Nitrotoga sp. M5 TaxID=2890409 RepID=UPI001EF4E80A|nr:helix-turn-helix transcriptional regulator [Candidatus Nitrotoga sp. M5]CAH1387049.1 putative Helix-turn-helix domain-containing protein [Candidatus Nitrotoga sp. M5]
MKTKKEPSNEDKAAAKRLSELWAEYKQLNKSATQEKSASDIGMTQSAFGQYLRGELPFGLEVTFKFANLFKVHIAEIKRFNILEEGFNKITPPSKPPPHKNEIIRTVVQLMENTSEITRIEICGIVRNYLLNVDSTSNTQKKIAGRTDTR